MDPLSAHVETTPASVVDVHSNAFLDRLDPDDRSALLAGSVRRMMNYGETLEAAGQMPWALWFPLSGTIAEYRDDRDGCSLRLSIAGPEGISSILTLYRDQPRVTALMCVGQGSAICVLLDHIQLLVAERPSLIPIFLGLSDKQMVSAWQLAFCNAYHSVEQRLARWVLETSFCSRSSIIRTTQADVASDLGVQRSSVVESMFKLKTKGVLRHTRNEIRINDLGGLINKSCGCGPAPELAYSSSMGDGRLT